MRTRTNNRGDRKVTLALLAAVAIVVTGCSLPGAPPPRPSCADKVAAALTSTMPVRGAYACMVGNYGSLLGQSGIASDDSWAAQNKALGAKPRFTYETQLHDGAYVYRQDLRAPSGRTVSFDLLIWIGPKGDVYTIDLVSVTDP